ncbi:MAG: hypothetical protein PWQ96_128 [Clostridia bacterium]|jgi:sensor histidine kinase regulating citrate/malate metabolism|nr:signal transduction histidine kinase regulating citrate/malate metabolism [Clostridiales bacterium]MDK2984486.1 hypothetical protein [Clostridia bacterium]
MKTYFYGGLSPQEILNIMRVQKHDQLNYLQVILGYLQLGKTKKALEYTRSAINSIQENGLIMKVHTSNMALMMMNILQEAQQIGVESKLLVSTMLSEIKQEEELCHLIDILWNALKAQLLRHPYDERYLLIDLSETGQEYLLVFKFPFDNSSVFEEEKRRINEIASFNEIAFDFQKNPSGGIIRLSVSI